MRACELCRQGPPPPEVYGYESINIQQKTQHFLSYLWAVEMTWLRTMLVVPAEGPELDPQEHIKKLCMVVWAVVPGHGKQG